MKKLMKVLGWVLIVVTVGPIGMSYQLIANPSLAGFVFVGMFVFFFGLGIWLVRRQY